ncbi:hypothetical protein CSUI_009215, partial [Cystoisospora suis]
LQCFFLFFLSSLSLSHVNCLRLLIYEDAFSFFSCFLRLCMHRVSLRDS